ncbi:hypothetical protein L207DRAFT_512810 [Hyaloscypha variabilis F]|uniref:Uncharacterized protein n=1 Tax=Hyaloscypha variabilis (strain UAMH 11265 / GT02V1 / F) TaxID=1149755 RepID=A0A2J6RMV8_HYAVF|nr:hypothetical protein L207DRAFT_512810 [Hyaloscypha variabilis F]
MSKTRVHLFIFIYAQPDAPIVLLAGSVRDSASLRTSSSRVFAIHGSLRATSSKNEASRCPFRDMKRQSSVRASSGSQPVRPSRNSAMRPTIGAEYRLSHGSVAGDRISIPPSNSHQASLIKVSTLSSSRHRM